jgi:hypothetical protein
VAHGSAATPRLEGACPNVVPSRPTRNLALANNVAAWAAERIIYRAFGIVALA